MNRIQDIQKALETHKLDAMLLTSPIARRWATGFHSSAGVLVVTEKESVYITDCRYIEAAKANVQEAKIQLIETGQPYTALIGEVLSRNHIKRLGFEDATMTQADYTRYSQKLDVELVPASTLLDDLRASKTAEELAIMRRAQEITDRTFAEILPIINTEMTERELVAEIVYRLMKNGADKASFDPIVVSGPRSSMPHGVPGDHKLEGFLILDFGAMHRGYCADMTRTVCLGEPTEEMRKIYETVLAAQLAGIAAARTGVVGKEIDRAARDVITAAGYGAYFGHGFGHGQGLEVHEQYSPRPTEERALPVGAVISAEPGIYLPGKFGVRIEDTLYLTETGNEILTRSPKSLTIL